MRRGKWPERIRWTWRVMPQRVPLSALKKGMDIGQYELLQGAL
ncbi:hypothetical protein [Erwinia tracheiphila]|nr:hypothetical protein [Erwinia tracheiphila]